MGTCPRCEGRNQSFLHATRLSATESDGLSAFSVTFLTRSGCHLCDDARAILERVAAKIRLEVTEVDIDDDDGLVSDWGLRVPVVLSEDGRVIAEGMIDDEHDLRNRIVRMPER